jgi:hypothetical protein
MRGVVAIIGAVVVFFIVLLVWGVVIGFMPGFPRIDVPTPPFASNPFLTDPRQPAALRTDNTAGLLLAILVALVSYRASNRWQGKEPPAGNH